AKREQWGRIRRCWCDGGMRILGPEGRENRGEVRSGFVSCSRFGDLMRQCVERAVVIPTAYPAGAQAKLLCAHPEGFQAGGAACNRHAAGLVPWSRAQPSLLAPTSSAMNGA